MRGGVVYKKTAVSLDEQLKVILSGSTFQYLQHGGYGFVFKVTFPGDSGFVNEYWVVYPHPNTSLNVLNKNVPIKDLFIKDFITLFTEKINFQQ